MKKFVIVMLVLGIATAANATLSLVVDLGGGYEDLESSDVVLEPTDYIWIGVYSDVQGVAGAPGQYNAYVAIPGDGAGNPAPGSWTGNIAVYSPPAIAAAYAVPYGYTFGADWVSGVNADGVPTNYSDIGVGFGYEFHCDGEGPVLIELHDGTMGNVVDTLIIHQIPEPATIALLGLGGLLLRRRK